MSIVPAWLWVGLLVLFVILNGLFVAAEYALIRLRKSRVEEMLQQNVRGAKTIQKLQMNMDQTVAGAQLGITVMGLAVGGVGGEPIQAALEQFCHFVSGYIPILANIQVPGFVGLAISFLLLTFLHVIVGEQLPKLVSLRTPEKVALALSLPFSLFCKFTTPFLVVINFITRQIMRLPGMPGETATSETPPSVEELIILVENSTRAGTLDKAESGLVQRALEYRGLTVKDVMVPASHMDCLSEDMSLVDALDVIMRTKHSRLPLYRGNRETVVGILRTRELLDILRKKLRMEVAAARHPRLPVQVVSATEPIGKLQAYIRKPFFVKDDTGASVLLEELKKRHMQLAIIVDKSNKVIGLVTQEDLVEQLVGEIHDEDDGPIEGVELLSEGVFKVEGSLTLYEFRRVFDARLSSSGSGTTVQEVFLENFTGTVTAGSQLELQGFAFKVLSCKPSSDAGAGSGNKVEIEWLEVHELPDTTGGEGESK